MHWEKAAVSSGIVTAIAYKSNATKLCHAKSHSFARLLSPLAGFETVRNVAPSFRKRELTESDDESL